MAAGAISSLVGCGGVKVTNPLPAVGGADAASLAEALDTIPAEVHRRDRAVVAEDFRALALEVPGVVRAEALPLLHPDTPRRRGAGRGQRRACSRPTTRATPGAPLPDVSAAEPGGRVPGPAPAGDHRALRHPADVRRRRSVGRGAVEQGYQVDAVRRWVEQILRQYLSPLPPDGPDGAGLAAGPRGASGRAGGGGVQVDGVEYVEQELLLAVPDGAGGWSPTQLVPAHAWQVPRIAHLVVVSGAPLPPGSRVRRTAQAR